MAPWFSRIGRPPHSRVGREGVAPAWRAAENHALGLVVVLVTAGTEAARPCLANDWMVPSRHSNCGLFSSPHKTEGTSSGNAARLADTAGADPLDRISVTGGVTAHDVQRPRPAGRCTSGMPPCQADHVGAAAENSVGLLVQARQAPSDISGQQVTLSVT